jgi:phosphatidyl-myo-inositol dimannoside synthase
VIGEGPQRPAIRAAIDKHGLQRHVRLLGRAADDLYAAAYNGADVFVMPNIMVPGDMEGFGLVLLEAALCALPVVAADMEGIRDAVADGRNGRLVPSSDAIGFQKSIRHFLDDPAAAKKFGRQSRDYTLQHYRWDTVAGHYLDIYKKLLD